MAGEKTKKYEFSRNSITLSILATLFRIFAWIVMLAILYVTIVFAINYPPFKEYVCVIAICVAIHELVLYYVIAGFLDAMKNMQDIGAVMIHMQDLQLTQMERLGDYLYGEYDTDPYEESDADDLFPENEEE